MQGEIRVGAVVINREGRVAVITSLLSLVNIDLDPSHKKCWVLPKGHIEGADTAPQTALKEACEEVGVEGVITDQNNPLITSHVQKGRYFVKGNTGPTEEINVNIVTYWYRVDSYHFSPDLAEDVREVVWITPEEAIKLLTFSVHQEVVRYFCERKAV